MKEKEGGVNMRVLKALILVAGMSMFLFACGSSSSSGGGGGGGGGGDEPANVSGFTYEKIVGKTFRMVEAKYGCETLLYVVNDSQMEVTQLSDTFTTDYTIDNGVIIILPSAQTTFTLISEESNGYNVEMTHAGGEFSEQWVEKDVLRGNNASSAVVSDIFRIKCSGA